MILRVTKNLSLKLGIQEGTPIRVKEMKDPDVNIFRVIKDMMTQPKLQNQFRDYNIESLHLNLDGTFNSLLSLEGFSDYKPSSEFMDNLKKFLKKTKGILKVDLKVDSSKTDGRLIVDITHR